MVDEEGRKVVAEIPGVVALLEDGSIRRYASLFPSIPANPDFSNAIATKDVILDPQNGIWCRLFLPTTVVSSGNRAPLVLHFHGGSMCMGSPDSTVTHKFGSRMASKSSSIWISVAYRLAPEHRLPTPYDDCHAALCWLRSQSSEHGEAWIKDYGDLARCFLAGESAGGTIVHFVSMRATGKDLRPLQLRGLMLIHPGFFPHVPKMRPDMDPTLKSDLVEASLKLSLPEGADDVAGIIHPLVNPFHEDSKPKLQEVEIPPSIVFVAGKDLLYDAGVRYYEALKKANKEVELFNSEKQGHCFHVLKEGEEEDREALENQIISFMQRLLD